MSGAAREGTCHAAGDFLVRPGAFDAVGDSNPVPARAGCPWPEVSAPDRAQRLPSRAMSPTAHHVLSGTHDLHLTPSAVTERQDPTPDECLTRANLKRTISTIDTSIIDTECHHDDQF